MPKLSEEDRVVAGLFLCSTEGNEILAFLKPIWNSNASLSINEKLVLLDKDLVVRQIFLGKKNAVKVWQLNCLLNLFETA